MQIYAQLFVLLLLHATTVCFGGRAQNMQFGPESALRMCQRSAAARQ